MHLLSLLFNVKYVYDRHVLGEYHNYDLYIASGITRIFRGNLTRNQTGKFPRGRVAIASGTGSRGDAAIIVQIKEDVNSLSFASRVTLGNIQLRDARRTREKKSSDNFCARRR